MKKNFKVGDIVYFNRFGNIPGKVVEIDSNLTTHPLIVEFDNGEQDIFIIEKHFTIDGKTDYMDELPSLSLDPFKLPEDWNVKPELRVEKCESYYYVDIYGEVVRQKKLFDKTYNKLLNCGNYFKTVEEAKESKFYKVFHE